MLGWTAIIWEAMWSPVESASKPQWTSEAWAMSGASQAGLGLAPEVEMQRE
jgi:hypothetical protein